MEKQYLDAEYESIRDIFDHRGTRSGQLPGRIIRFIPEERADTVLALDARILKIRENMPVIVICGLILSFLLGLAV